MNITFTKEFDEISNGLLGIRRKHATEALTAYDKVEKFTRLDDDDVYAFMKYIAGQRCTFAIIVVARQLATDFRVSFALKAYPSLSVEFFSLSPVDVLKKLFQRFCPLPEKEGMKFLYESVGFVFHLEAYLLWIMNRGVPSELETAAFLITQFAKQELSRKLQGKQFRQQVFIALHDFCYYCRRHPKSLGRLREDEIRDLFLVVLCSVFGTGEAEAYNNRGKLDFKIVNPENRYDWITGEFKWWRGVTSAQTVFDQAVRIHATGQEAEIFVILLSKNRDHRDVFEQASASFACEPESVPNSFERRLVSGSPELFGILNLRFRGYHPDFCFGVADLFVAESVNS